LRTGYSYCAGCGAYFECPDIVEDSALYCRDCNEVIVILNKDLED
jgi:hypothetical protein